MEIQTLDKNGIDFLTKEEGVILHPYRDSVGIPTIGIGMTYYPDTDKKVTMTDKPLTTQQAQDYFIQMLKPYCLAVYSTTRDNITQNNFNALVSLCYNIGTGGFKGSTVHRLVEGMIIGEPLLDAFLMWDKADHKFNQNLHDRRQREYNLYMTV